MQRRTFLKWSLKASTLTVLTVAGWGCSRNDKDADHPLRLPPLPYARDALEPYYKEECLKARQALSLPLILVGGMRRLRDMQGIIDDGIADAVSLCRPFINAPDMVRGFKQGTADSSECNSCNECIELMLEGRFQCALTLES